MFCIFPIQRDLPWGREELALIEEAEPLLEHATSKDKGVQGPLLQTLSIIARLQRALIALFCLVACAGVLMRIRDRLITSVEHLQSTTARHPLVLLSAHLGPKFFGLQSVLTMNKVRFAEINNMSLYLAEDFYKQKQAGGYEIKLQLALAAFSELGSTTTWAIWIDGDAWLTERPVDLWKELMLKENSDVDMIVGTEYPGMNSSTNLPPCLGISTGVWAIRNSPASISVLQRLLALSPSAYGKDHFDDQCAIEALWKMDPATRFHARVFSSADTGRRLQCRTQRKCTRYFPDLCCSAESWNIQWPASDWHDLAERVVEEETGTDLLTRVLHSIEVDACTIATKVEGKPVPACHEVLSGA
jgi:hypothetical protein